MTLSGIWTLRGAPPTTLHALYLLASQRSFTNYLQQQEVFLPHFLHTLCCTEKSFGFHEFIVRLKFPPSVVDPASANTVRLSYLGTTVLLPCLVPCNISHPAVEESSVPDGSIVSMRSNHFNPGYPKLSSRQISFYTWEKVYIFF